MTTHRSTNPISPPPDCFPRGEVIEVRVLLLESHLSALEERASRTGMTTGQLIRRVIVSYLTTDAQPGETDLVPLPIEGHVRPGDAPSPAEDRGQAPEAAAQV
jgi:hypothetical protein